MAIVNDRDLIKALPPGVVAIRPAGVNTFWVIIDGEEVGKAEPYPKWRHGETVRHPETGTLYRPDHSLNTIQPEDTRPVPISWREAMALQPGEYVQAKGRNFDLYVPVGTVVPGFKWSKPGVPCRSRGCERIAEGATNADEIVLCGIHAAAHAKAEANDAKRREERQRRDAAYDAEADWRDKIAALGVATSMTHGGKLAINPEGLYGLLTAVISELGAEVFGEILPVELRTIRKGKE